LLSRDQLQDIPAAEREVGGREGEGGGDMEAGEGRIGEER
jgi:hypothetical protein